jgi:Flp pilus assembly protein TadG
MKMLRNDSGTTTLEFAVVFPVMLAFTFGIIQIASILWVDSLLHDAVNLAARCETIYLASGNTPKSPCATDMQTTARNMLELVPSQMGTLTFDASYMCNGSGVFATFTESFFFLPLPVSPPLSIHAKSCYPNYPS